MSLAEAEKWLDHLTSCSPCYSDFSQFKVAYQHRRTRALLAIAASILIVACVASWALFFKQKGPPGVQTAVLDLRNRSIPRETKPNPGEKPLEVSRGVKRLNVYLLLGSNEGPYRVRILAPTGESVSEASGMAKLNDHVTVLQVVLPLSSLRSGKYVLQIRRSESEWTSYSMVLR